MHSSWRIQDGSAYSAASLAPDQDKPSTLLFHLSSGRNLCSLLEEKAGVNRCKQMASMGQRNAARKNIQKAAFSAKRKRTIAHLPKSIRTALGKKASSVAKKGRKSRSRG
jgi:hypothetical protein